MTMLQSGTGENPIVFDGSSARRLHASQDLSGGPVGH
jgi:hypothetical protein